MIYDPDKEEIREQVMTYCETQEGCNVCNIQIACTQPGDIYYTNMFCYLILEGLEVEE